MFDIGWSEMAIIMLLALIIIGPKDLPRVARTIGQWVRKGRMMAREFQTSLEDMARDTELEDVKKEIEKVGRTDFKKAVENTIDPKGDLAKAFDTAPDTDKAKTKPALTDQSADDGSKTSAANMANGHANGKTSPSAGTKAKASTAGKAASAKPPASKAKTAKRVAKKPQAKAATKKPAAAKKPVSAAKRSVKPAASASGSKTKTGTAKRGSETSPADEASGTDQAAVAAKPS